MEVYEFLVPGRPVSVHSKKEAERKAWRSRLAVAATRASPLIPPFLQRNARLTIIFFCNPERRIDVDNVIKEIMNELQLICYADDEVVSDVDSHRRTWQDEVKAEMLPELLRSPWAERKECVYVRIQESRPMEDLL